MTKDPHAPPAPLGLRVASGLSCLLSLTAFAFASGVILRTHLPAGRSPPSRLAMAGIGLMLAYAGYGLWRRWGSAGCAALVVAIGFPVLLLVTTGTVPLLTLFVHGFVAVLVIENRRVLWPSPAPR